ncbi:hypothetical protein HHI36_001286 [Cryptolaemus montrouzieri]|uniref:Uncharacterized protein n=1 Tax=Cryptolaemus montrouzieri TaxID=559131 RepID=A0ABD2P747_9CUCU
MHFQMVLFIALTVLFSPIITLEALTLFEISTTIKGPVISNPFIPFRHGKTEKVELEVNKEDSEEIAYDIKMQSTQSHKPIKFRSRKHHLEEIEETETKFSNDEKGNDSMKQMVTICTNSFANVKLNNLFACIWQGVKAI